VLEPVESTLWVDADRVVQTMTNLLSNAVKFAPAGSTVTLRGSIEDSNVLFEVADEGRGIPASKLDVIFERFQQVDASDSREKGGSGLGLAICRSIVRHHGGAIWAKSEVGRGSTFRFTIPHVQLPRLEAAQDVARSVLVCDDDPEMRDVMVNLLEARGLRALGVGSGPELLAAAADARPDVILLDIVMPGMNGWHTLAALKGNQQTAAVPVVIVSILPPEKYEDVAGWVQKPLDEATLFETIERAFRNADRRGRVMLVEDDGDLSRVIAASFERHGIDTFHAATGNEAIEMAQRIEPDLLVLDLALPGVDGFGVVDWLKDHDRLAHVPLIVYSASEPSPSQRERLTLGPTEFLTKSRVSPEDFERRVVDLLDKIAGGREELHRVA
jgi:CheY-like chemotaxis protein